MKTKSENSLPKILSGTVHEQFIRCGKSNCKCAGNELHGPYFYYFVRIEGKLKKRYLKPSEVEKVRSGCWARQEEKRREIKNKNKTWKLLRKIRKNLRAITNPNQIKN